MKTNSISAGLEVHARTTATTRQLIFRRAWLWTSFLAFATIVFAPPPAQAAVTEAWVQRYGSEAGSQDNAYKVVTDAAGNVIVAGYTENQTSRREMLVIEYSGAGVPLWTNRYNGTANGYAEARAVAVDASGNVFVTGLDREFSGDQEGWGISDGSAGLRGRIIKSDDMAVRVACAESLIAPILQDRNRTVEFLLDFYLYPKWLNIR